jgi:hypothetical protein
MPRIVTAVSSGAIDYDANCYVSLAYADAFFRAKLEGEEWVAQSEEMRERALISATAAIDNLLAGQSADKYDAIDAEQPLMFPRSWDRDDSGTLEIPDDIENAACLLALHLLRLQTGAAGPIDGDELRRIGAQSVSMDGLSVGLGPRSWSTWPGEVKRLVAPYWRRAGRTTEGPGTKPRWTRGWVGT